MQREKRASSKQVVFPDHHNGLTGVFFNLLGNNFKLSKAAKIDVVEGRLA